MTILINPKSPNQMPTRAIEPPIWCALMAKDGDVIIDNEIEKIPRISGDIVVVVMGSNPSASSTPKMPEAMKLLEKFPSAKITGLHPMAVNIATYPFPKPEELVKVKMAKWRVLQMDKYRAHNWHCLHDIDNRDKYAVLYTSYGCPYNCDYCNIHTLYGSRKVYYRNPLDIGDELGYLVKNYGIKNLKLCDEIFTLNPAHVSAVCDVLKEFHLNVWAYARVGTVTPPMLMKMKEAGINWLAYGFESGSDKVLKGVSKIYRGSMEAVEMTRQAGINIMGNFIFGLPDDTYDTMEDTFQLSKKIKCEYVNFYCAMAYPGSKLYSGEDKDWSHYNQYNPVPMGTKYLTPHQVVSFRNSAFQRYFTDEHYLKMVEHKFGIKAKSHIEAMVK